jgi:hypothetical protein
VLFSDRTAEREKMNDFGSDGLKCRLRGMAIRDEFLCPIMYQLFRDPVIAYDGHTYERAAIENWLENHQTSPRTGNKMVSLFSILFYTNLMTELEDPHS